MFHVVPRLRRLQQSRCSTETSPSYGEAMPIKEKTATAASPRLSNSWKQ